MFVFNIYNLKLVLICKIISKYDLDSSQILILNDWIFLLTFLSLEVTVYIFRDVNDNAVLKEYLCKIETILYELYFVVFLLLSKPGFL